MFSLSFWASVLLTLFNSEARADAEDIVIRQPLSTVTTTIGGSAILPCISKSDVAGPVKWFKGTGPSRLLIYSDKESTPRVQKLTNTNEIWDICINNITSQDEGCYYCVKFTKNNDKEVSSGPGTRLIVEESKSQSSPDVLIAALVGSISLIILILLVLCCYLKKQKGLRPCLSRPEASKKNQPLKETRGNNEIVYADLQPIGKNHQCKSSAQVKDLHSEYATIHVQ